MDILSRLDLYERGRRYILTHAKKIEAAIVDTLGSDANIFVGSVSFMAHAVSRQLTRNMKAQLWRTAEGEELDRLMFDKYREKRKGAAPARTPVVFSRPAASAVTFGAGTVPIGTKLTTSTGIEYITTTEATFGATDVTSTANVRAVQAGKAFQVGANFIRKIARPDQLFDPTLTVTNPARSAGGEDAEDDSTARERVRDFWNTQQRGTLRAIEFGAKLVPGVTSASATEALTGAAQPARVVTMNIADSSGVASETLGNDALVSLDEWRAGGIAVLISLSQPQIVSVRLKLVFAAGVATAQLRSVIRTAVVGYINSLGTNQILQRAALGSVLLRYKQSGLIVSEETVIEPAGDVVPNPGSTLRTTITDVVTV